MTFKHLLFGERSLTKVAGLFENRRQAAAVARRLQDSGALDAPQIMLVGPPDSAGSAGPAFSRKVEPEPVRIGYTLVRAHLTCGALGALVGLLLYAFLAAQHNPAVVSSPGLSLLAIVFFSLLVGLLVGGLVSLRPDHLRVISAVRHALRQGRWAIVVHPLTPRQVELALHELRGRSYRVVRSL